jgi:hypothetical protein
MAEKKASNAANPPADAPMPTMGKPVLTGTCEPVCSGASTGKTAAGSAGEAIIRLSLLAGFLVILNPLHSALAFFFLRGTAGFSHPPPHRKMGLYKGTAC